MSAQLSLDAIGGIDWSCPKLEQLEQFAIEHIQGCTTHLESHSSSMSVCVEKDGSTSWMRPVLERTEEDRLEWVVVVELANLHGFVTRSDQRLEAVLTEIFEEDE